MAKKLDPYFEMMSEWPGEFWDALRFPADLIMGGSREEYSIRGRFGPGDLTPAPKSSFPTSASKFKMGDPRRKQAEVAAMSNPLFLVNPGSAAKSGLGAINEAVLSGQMPWITNFAMKPRGGGWLGRENIKGAFDPYKHQLLEGIGNPPEVLEKAKAYNRVMDMASKYVLNDMSTYDDPRLKLFKSVADENYAIREANLEAERAAAAPGSRIIVATTDSPMSSSIRIRPIGRIARPRAAESQAGRTPIFSGCLSGARHA